MTYVTCILCGQPIHGDDRNWFERWLGFVPRRPTHHPSVGCYQGFRIRMGLDPLPFDEAKDFVDDVIRRRDG